MHSALKTVGTRNANNTNRLNNLVKTSTPTPKSTPSNYGNFQVTPPLNHNEPPSDNKLYKFRHSSQSGKTTISWVFDGEFQDALKRATGQIFVMITGAVSYTYREVGNFVIKKPLDSDRFQPLTDFMLVKGTLKSNVQGKIPLTDPDIQPQFWLTEIEGEFDESGQTKNTVFNVKGHLAQPVINNQTQRIRSSGDMQPFEGTIYGDYKKQHRYGFGYFTFRSANRGGKRSALEFNAGTGNLMFKLNASFMTDQTLHDVEGMKIFGKPVEYLLELDKEDHLMTIRAYYGVLDGVVNIPDSYKNFGKDAYFFLHDERVAVIRNTKLVFFKTYQDYRAETKKLSQMTPNEIAKAKENAENAARLLMEADIKRSKKKTKEKRQKEAKLAKAQRAAANLMNEAYEEERRKKIAENQIAANTAAQKKSNENALQRARKKEQALIDEATYVRYLGEKVERIKLEIPTLKNTNRHYIRNRNYLLSHPNTSINTKMGSIRKMGVDGEILKLGMNPQNTLVYTLPRTALDNSWKRYEIKFGEPGTKFEQRPLNHRKVMKMGELDRRVEKLHVFRNQSGQRGHVEQLYYVVRELIDLQKKGGMNVDPVSTRIHLLAEKRIQSLLNILPPELPAAANKNRVKNVVNQTLKKWGHNK